MITQEASDGGIVNALTIDLDEAPESGTSSSSPPDDPGPDKDGIAKAVENAIAHLAEHDARATFFVLGSVAERYPALVCDIVAAGHEVASHGYSSRPANEQGYGEYVADLRLAKAVLEDITKAPVNGYRAPGFSVGMANASAFDCILEAGYRYSSSSYPTSRSPYTTSASPRFAHEPRAGLLEIPLATVRALGFNWPVGDDHNLRRAPYAFTRRSVRRINERDGHSALICVRLRNAPVDAGDPNNTTNLQQPAAPLETHLKRLLTDFRWERVDRVFLR